MLISAPAHSVHVLDWPLSFSFFFTSFLSTEARDSEPQSLLILIFFLIFYIEALSESLSRYVLISLNDFLTIMIKQL